MKTTPEIREEIREEILVNYSADTRLIDLVDDIDELNRILDAKNRQAEILACINAGLHAKANTRIRELEEKVKLLDGMAKRGYGEPQRKNDPTLHELYDVWHRKK